VVEDLIAAKKAAGVAIIGIFHDLDVREKVANRLIDVSGFSPRKKAA
jgi:alpha-D-ribose 1-methylphosphonate 5-triphosphate synthase subunit PhnL